MSDLKCVLVPKWVFVLYEDAPTGVSQVGSECDFCMWHWSLFLCQSGTPVIKKLLRIALTVRLFVGNEMNCSPCLSASMKDLFVFCHFKGLRHSLQSLSFSSWRDWFTVAVTDGCMKKRGWWVSAKKKKKGVIYRPVSWEPEKGFELYVWLFIHTRRLWNTLLPYQKVDRLPWSFICINQQTRYLWL